MPCLPFWICVRFHTGVKDDRAVFNTIDVINICIICLQDYRIVNEYA